MSEEIKKMDDEELEQVAGGNDGMYGPRDPIHNLAYFAWHVVGHLPARTHLVMKKQHESGGTPMPGHVFFNGDPIWIHNSYLKDGHYLAFDEGEYGYVDARYVI